MAQSWLPRDVVLDGDLVDRLFAWHGTLPENQEACRNDFFQADRKEIQHLMQPLVNALPKVSGKGGTSLQAKAERALLVASDLDLMWEALGAQTKVERKDFRRCIETAPSDIFIGLIQHYAKLGDMSPLNFRAMNIESARQAWAEDDWETFDNGLGRFLASIRKGGKPTRAVATKEATQPTRKASATLKKKKSKAELPSNSLSPDTDMPSSPPLLLKVPRTTGAPTLPTPQIEDDRIADEAFARATGNVAAEKCKRVTSTEGTPKVLRKGIEDEALARAMGHTAARKSKPAPSTKGTPNIAHKEIQDEAFEKAVGKNTAGKIKHVETTEGTPNVAQKSFVDEAFARAMDSAAGKRKRAPSKDGTPDTATKDTHRPKRQRLTKDASAKSGRKSPVVPQVEAKLSSPIPVPSIQTQKILHNRQKLPQQVAPEKSIPKTAPHKEAPVKKEATSKGRPPGLRVLPDSTDLPGAKRTKTAEPLIVKKSQKKASSLDKAPQKTSDHEGLRQSKPSHQEKLPIDQVSSQLEEVSARLPHQDKTASRKRRPSKGPEPAHAAKETAEALQHWRHEEEKHLLEVEQRAMVVDERDTIEYWRGVEAKHWEEEKVRIQPEPVLPPPGSQEVHRLELERILEQRRIAEEQRSQQRSQQKDASQRRKSQTGVQDSEKKRRKQTKNQLRKQRREAQAALAWLQNRSLSPVKRRREATGTASPQPVREVDDSTHAEEASSAMQDEDMVDSSRRKMSSSEIQNHIEIETFMSNALEGSSPVAQRDAPLANSAVPSTPSVPAPACKTCRHKHRTCDRVHPDCGECSKRGVGCVWDRDAEILVQKPKTSSHKKKPKSSVPEPKACRTCNTKHRRCDRQVPICGECSKNGRECIWSNDTATSNVLDPVEATGSVEKPEHDEVLERDRKPEHRVELERDGEPEHVEQTELDEETPEERDMRQLASQLTTTQDEPASSTLLALESPPIRKSQRLSQTVIPILPLTRDEPIVQAHEDTYTSSQAATLALSKANIIARMKSNMASSQVSTASEDSDNGEDIEDEAQPESISPVQRRVMVAVEVPPASFFGRPDSEDPDANEDASPDAIGDTSPEADIDKTRAQAGDVIKDEEMEDETVEPTRPASPEIAKAVDEHMGEDVDDASNLSREDSEELVLHDISGYDSADAEDEDLRESEEDDEIDASVHGHERALRELVDDLASESSDDEEEESADDNSTEDTKSENEEEEEKVDTPAVNWGESSDDEDDNNIPGVRRVDANSLADPSQDSGNLANIDAKPVVPAQTQTPEPEDAATQDAEVQRSAQNIDMDAKLLVSANNSEKEVENSAQNDDFEQSSNDILEQNDIDTDGKPQSPVSSSFDLDKHRSLRESLVSAIQQDNDSEEEVDTKPSQPPRSASPELGEDDLLALSPSIFRHNIRSHSAEEEDSKHGLEVAESVYDDDDPVRYPELEDKLGRVSEEEPEDDVMDMDVDNDSVASVGDRPVGVPLTVHEKPLETPTDEPDIQMVDDDSDFSDDDLAGAEEFPRSKPLEEYPDDVKFEPSQLDAIFEPMSQPERLTQLQLPDLPPGMVASQHPAVLSPPLPTMGNMLSSPGECDVTATTAIEYTQTSPATSSSGDASVVTALEYSQDSPEPKPEAAPKEKLPKTDFGPTHIAEHVNKNVGPKSPFFNPMIRSAWQTMRMGRK